MQPDILRDSRPFLHRALRELPTLLYGVEASWNQMQLVQHALSLLEKERGYLKFAAELLAWAWQSRPLDKSALQGLASLQEHITVLPPQGRVFVGILNRHLQPSADEAEARADAQVLEALRQEEAPLPPALFERLSRPGSGLALLEQVFTLLMDEGRFQAVLQVLEQTQALASLPQLAQRLRAEWAMEALPPQGALAEIEAVDTALFAQWRDASRAAMLLRKDPTANAEEAGRLLRGIWQRFPWHINACLAAHELLAGPPPLAAEEDFSRVCVLLYSWNKAQDLERTLESLAGSSLGGARVLCLDNGSSDETPAMLERVAGQWRERGGLPELETLRLPVNVGAPAARDWLLTLPQARGSEFVAYLDDDIFLPPDWLPRLLGRAQATPKAGVVGCRIERHKSPHLLQAADFNILPPELCNSSFKDYREKVYVCNNGLGRRDNTLFRYARPCVSVTGCCHLLRTESLREQGGFDIRFSPSQFDDLERDLRGFAAGQVAVYDGSLAVRHVQHSSLQQAADRARQSHIHGNKLKLEHLFEEPEVRRLAARCRRLLLEDFTGKALELDALQG